MVAFEKLRSAGSAPLRTWLRTAGVLCGCVILASCREGVVDPRGPVGEAQRVERDGDEQRIGRHKTVQREKPQRRRTI